MEIHTSPLSDDRADDFPIRGFVLTSKSTGEDYDGEEGVKRGIYANQKHGKRGATAIAVSAVTEEQIMTIAEAIDFPLATGWGACPTPSRSEV
jgi:hypothetical protein